jgi:hypothetical protein
MIDPLAGLLALDRTALCDRWRSTFSQPAPRYCHLELLRAGLAWELQRVAAGMPVTTRRRIIQALGGKQRARPSPGTMLVREWNGKSHRVTVHATSFEYDGRSYRSLTAIARGITGTPWSGPRFFGLPA